MIGKIIDNYLVSLHPLNTAFIGMGSTSKGGGGAKILYVSIISDISINLFCYTWLDVKLTT